MNQSTRRRMLAKFAGRLNYQMKRNRMPVKTLSWLTGISDSTLRGYMHGQHDPGILHASLMRDAFGCDWEDLLGD